MTAEHLEVRLGLRLGVTMRVYGYPNLFEQRTSMTIYVAFYSCVVRRLGCFWDDKCFDNIKKIQDQIFFHRITTTTGVTT